MILAPDINLYPDLLTYNLSQENGKLLRNTSISIYERITYAKAAYQPQARSQPSDNGGGGSFSLDLDFFQGSKIGVPNGYLEETSIFLNNNDRWRYFAVKARIYIVSLLDFINSIS